MNLVILIPFVVIRNQLLINIMIYVFLKNLIFQNLSTGYGFLDGNCHVVAKMFVLSLFMPGIPLVKSAILAHLNHKDRCTVHDSFKIIIIS